MEFTEWLSKEKGFTAKVSRDYESRRKRALKLLGSDTISEKTIEELEKVPEFQNLSGIIRSQLRQAIRRYLEYQDCE